MKKVLNYITAIVIALLALYVAGGFLLPQTWKATQKITIKASPEKVYEQIAHLKNWQNWAPWNKDRDPTQVYAYEGPEMGVGAKWLWTSEKMGQGWLEIKKASLEDGISYELLIDMDGRKSTIEGAINYSNAVNGLEVIWTDQGDAGKSFNQRWLSLFIKVMIGKEMTAGLEKLKYICEQIHPEILK